MNWKYIFNPFLKFSEKELLIFGLVFLIINSSVCYFLGFKADSIFHFSPKGNLSYISVLMYCTLSIMIAFTVLFILGKIYNRKTRSIDLLNAVLISQALNFIIIFLTEIINIEEIAKRAKENMSLDFSQYFLLFLFLILSLPFTVYGFILIYNGFRTATNIKSWQKIVLFIFVLMVIMAFSPILLSTLNLNL